MPYHSTSRCKSCPKACGWLHPTFSCLLPLYAVFLSTGPCRQVCLLLDGDYTNIQVSECLSIDPVEDGSPGGYHREASATTSERVTVQTYAQSHFDRMLRCRATFEGTVGGRCSGPRRRLLPRMLCPKSRERTRTGICPVAFLQSTPNVGQSSSKEIMATCSTTCHNLTTRHVLTSYLSSSSKACTFCLSAHTACSRYRQCNRRIS
jgi:hypothetical protein